ncbi:hypothetical protein CASFOL_028213 [Castilleja foliolosa]|uniref:Uncharacterized protein n=1 Tax=Castilleja foliolosa TaxID=1961234 RepID=A0ABD3CDY5_9LAMI
MVGDVVATRGDLALGLYLWAQSYFTNTWRKIGVQPPVHGATIFH